MLDTRGASWNLCVSKLIPSGLGKGELTVSFLTSSLRTGVLMCTRADAACSLGTACASIGSRPPYAA